LIDKISLADNSVICPKCIPNIKNRCCDVSVIEALHNKNIDIGNLTEHGVRRIRIEIMTKYIAWLEWIITHIIQETDINAYNASKNHLNSLYKNVYVRGEWVQFLWWI
jgi:hypothetical protein